jgi:phosphohistidine phosphatase
LKSAVSSGGRIGFEIRRVDMRLYLVHHADAVSPAVDTRRPLSAEGLVHADRLAASAQAAGVRPAAIWHSGKLRARQTAEAFWRACNPLAEFKMIRGLAPDDPPGLARDLVAGESRDVMLVGHMPHLAALRQLLTGNRREFPPHGMVVLTTEDDGRSWRDVSEM